ncbi:unnamed protein product [Candidula unifasciata]|uniref:Metalloendopeptidase n=1 Tax=Candidula unifasciata TaxID=100452 RepID=A0A8S3YPT8_9EUPU|nr:unnamed protein product [Candidula unifasciata]
MSAAIFGVLIALCGFGKLPVDGKPVVTSVSGDLPDVPQDSLLSEPIFLEQDYKRESDVFHYENYVIEGARVRRQAVMNKTRIWPGGVVPYVLDKAFSPDELATIEAAMREVEQNVGNSTHPCVRFIPRTTEVNYLDAHAGDGCSSVIGLDFTGPQVSTFAPACVIKGLLLHELLHTLGIYHEQDRFDRDDYISMNATNLRADAERNYVLKNMSDIDILGTSYDFGSIMHYGPYSFPKDPQYPVMTPKPKYAAGTYMGQRSAIECFRRSESAEVVQLSGRRLTYAVRHHKR